MQRIKISSDSRCTLAVSCFPVTGKKSEQNKWIEKNDLFINKDNRVFALVDTVDTVYFMDAITGSLYQFDECLNSSKLKTGKLKRSKINATKILLNTDQIS